MEKFFRMQFPFWIFILYLLFINIYNIPYEKSDLHKTSKGFSKITGKSNKSNIAKPKNKNNERKLDELTDDEVFPLNIFIDLYNFNYTFPNETMLEHKNNTIKAIYNAKNLLEKFIKIATDISADIKRYDDSYLEEWGLKFWDSEIFEQHMDLNTYNYYILFRFNTSINTVASSLIVDSYSAPTIGVITINEEKILEKQLTQNYLNNLMLQQFIYLLGFQKESDSFSNWVIQEDCEYEGEEIEFCIPEENAEKLFEYTKKYFGCETIGTIYLESDEDGNIHWPARQFLGEIMTNFDYPEEKVLSEFTLRYLEDLGYYKIDHKYTGGLMRFGKNKGCKFFKGNCGRNLEEDVLDEGEKGVNDNKIIFSNEFYLPVTHSSSPKPSCSSGRLSKTIYQLHELNSEDHLDNPEYSLNNLYIGPRQANYCPIAEFNTDSSVNFYTGSCSDLETSTDDSLYEEKGNNSFCILRSLEDNNEIRAACYKMFCSSKSLTILIGENYIVCPRSGGKIFPDKSEYYILCPDYNLICSGKKLCNNIFDCIDIGSEEEPTSLDYNYPIKTTQNYTNFKVDPIITEGVWELSDDNTKTCPYLCMQCDLEYKCTKCRPNYKVYDKQENKCYEIVPNCQNYNENEICIFCNEGFSLVQEYNGSFVCIDIDTINTGYYYFKEDGKTFYERCNSSILHCEKCSSNTVCIKCMGVLKIIDNGESCGDITSKKYYKDTSDGDKFKSCSNYLGFSNCDECDFNGVTNFECLRCKSGYVFIHDDDNTVSCFKESSLMGNIYYKEDADNYYKCQTYSEVDKCVACSSKDICLGCQNEYQIENANSVCLLSSDITSHLYYKDTNNYYYPCSNSLSNCYKCDSKTVCTECISSSDYYIDNTGKCFEKNLYEVEHFYYKIGDTNIYGSCSEILNCERCNSITDCTSCKPGYYFVLEEENKFKCQIINLDNYYESTQDGKTYYIKCDKDIPNCEKCSTKNYCSECSNNYALIEDDHTKCESLSNEKYYRETSSGKYRLCNKKFSNCEKCTLDESNFSCKQCEANYVLKHDNANSISCVEKSSIKVNNSFFSDDSELNYYACNAFNDVDNCEKCFNKITCSDCKTSYKLVNQNTSCFLEEDIENSLIYHDTALNIYIRCSDLIQDCQQCSDRATCFNCQNGSVVEENNTCISKELVENNSYVQDETTGKYVSCSIIDNCITCSSKTICTKCQEGFNINDGICKMVSHSEGDKDKKLSTRVIVGIVFGCVGFLLIVAGVVYFLLKKFKKIGPIKSETNLPVNEEKVSNFENEQQDIIKNNPDSEKVKKRSIHNA